MVSFATGGYARGLRTGAMMHKIDTDGDGTVSHDEFIAYQVKIFDMMDTSTTHKGMLGSQEMFATGGNNAADGTPLNHGIRAGGDRPPAGPAQKPRVSWG